MWICLILSRTVSVGLFAADRHIRCVARCAQMFMQEDVAQRHKFGKIPVSRARPEKFVRFLLAATSNHVQVMLG